ncbi:DEAD/DEAH box helicase [Desulfovibrio inopinatus]|uniref:DEAD/DEAH box helicase n=1 Tax=Desulfovibrio inopinatus TaxID=102109 RepID=UPI0004137E75|nr:DEAD/DEAH box helicase [Desulfovibrio inopinatus]
MSLRDIFHPLIADWFSKTYGSPTPIQAEAWPAIARGDHVLACAPTGSGKTLMAFLYGLNQLATGAFSPGEVRILYISPLKALNTDVAQNLREPARAIAEAFAQAEQPVHSVRIMTRSGDTPSSERRRMLSRPPEILVTTPESLGILLTTQPGSNLFSALSMVILDEIHAVMSNKRGAYLMANVDRLVALSGNFQRIAMSATIQPRETAAAFVGGFVRQANGRVVPRPMTVLSPDPTTSHGLELTISDPMPSHSDKILPKSDIPVWDAMAARMVPRILSNRSTLVFTNTRRLCERLTRLLNEQPSDHIEPVAFSHHGSLSKAIRQSVETRLKHGELKAIVATDSLELGIDIGELDEVLLVETPPSVSKALQRIGRAGHGVGQTSHATLYPSHGLDLLQAAALGMAVAQRDIEPVRPVLGPLDVLAQIIVSMSCTQPRNCDTLFDELRLSYPFHTLSRRQFDGVIDMLAGRFEHLRLAELTPQVHFDRLDNTISAKPSSARRVFLSGGVIPDRGYFRLRHAGTKSIIGELDEEFVWEATIGQTFPFGAGLWRITDITAADVLAEPASRSNAPAPFYKGEQRGRDTHFSTHVATLLTELDERRDAPDLAHDLMKRSGLDTPAVERLLDFLETQRRILKTELPGSTRIVIERASLAAGGAPGGQLSLHCPWGLPQTRPLALALEAAALRHTGCQTAVFAGDDLLVFAGLQQPDELDLQAVLRSLNPDNIDELVAARLDSTGFFGTRFRECAGRALLLPRAGFNKRTPLWLTRLRAKKMLATVRQLPDFPIVLEAWRECLHDAFDMDGLRGHLADIEAGNITILEARTYGPSPFARAGDWPQINQLMYEDDTPQASPQGNGPGLDASLLAEIQTGNEAHPVLDPDIVATFTAKRKRLFPGYGPADDIDFLDHVKDRLLIPENEFHDLLTALHGQPDITLLSEHVRSRLCRCLSPKARNTHSFIAAVENLPHIQAAFPQFQNITVFDLNDRQYPLPAPLNLDDSSRADLLLQWLSYVGPLSSDVLQNQLLPDQSDLEKLLGLLLASHRIIQSVPMHGIDASQNLLLDAESDAILLRLCRQAARRRVVTQPLDHLPAVLATRQGLIPPGQNEDDLYDRVTLLSCLPIPVGLLETEIIPARVTRYDMARFDSLFSQSDLLWFGQGEKTILLCPENERVLAFNNTSPNENSQALAQYFVDPHAAYDVTTLARHAGIGVSQLTPQIWEAVWQGYVVNTGFAALRQGLAQNFSAPTSASSRPTSGRSSSRRGRRRPPRFSEWKSHIPFGGSWRLLPPPTPPRDAVDEQERCRERIRLLLDRYGILFRDLLRRELPAFSWSRLFRDLRLMEFSGEVLAGVFFDEIPGPQFAAPDLVTSPPDPDAVYWINAADPASVCGLSISGLRATHPDRRPTTHLCYHGNRLVFLSQRLGKNLIFHEPPDSPGLERYLLPLTHLLTRTVSPLPRIKVETINDLPAGQSPYLSCLHSMFLATREPSGVSLCL